VPPGAVNYDEDDDAPVRQAKEIGFVNGSPSRTRVHRVRRPRVIVAAAALAALLGLAPRAHAAPATWADWWLPTNYSEHGIGMDWLFNVIFWITMIIFVAVEVLLVYFAIKYRFRPERRKGVFSHGNTRLEMIWTLVPAVILIWISLATKQVWDEYRFGTRSKAGERAQVLVVGEQFKWNVVYPGPDGKLGRYLAYPKITDPKYNFKPRDQAVRDVENDLRDNPMGQSINPDDPNDPGKDDDYSRQPGRPMVVPANRPLEVVLSAKDVLHSFFLPNFRVKLDAVPGLRGLIYFTAVERSTREASIEAVPAGKQIWLDQTVPGVVLHGNPKTFKIFDPNDKQKNLTRRRVWLQSLESLEDVARKRLLREKVALEDIKGERLAAEIWEVRQDLKAIGIEQLSYVERPFEIVCEELCGLGHYTMRGDMIVVSAEQYDDFINREARAASAKPAAAPAAGAAAEAAKPAEPAAPTGKEAPAPAELAAPTAEDAPAPAEPASPPAPEPQPTTKQPAPAPAEPAPAPTEPAAANEAAPTVSEPAPSTPESSPAPSDPAPDPTAPVPAPSEAAPPPSEPAPSGEAAAPTEPAPQGDPAPAPQGDPAPAPEPSPAPSGDAAKSDSAPPPAPAEQPAPAEGPAPADDAAAGN
jgi:cytochrome c oxidase subunit 2